MQRIIVENALRQVAEKYGMSVEEIEREIESAYSSSAQKVISINSPHISAHEIVRQLGEMVLERLV